MTKKLLFGLSMLWILSAEAVECPKVYDVLFTLNETSNIQSVSAQIAQIFGGNAPVVQILPLSKALNIWTIRRNSPFSDADLAQIQAIKGVQNAHRSLKLQNRYTTPNDTFFKYQLYHKYLYDPSVSPPWGINSVSAWDYNKGMTTAEGDTIVIAVIEDGFDTAHIDLDYSFNYGEIPYDGIDNDSNGYIDDYRGWNSKQQNGLINTYGGLDRQHAMEVAGIVGAKGNNSIGIAGVAWNVKILPIAYNIDEAGFVAAMDYVMHEKKRYLSSHGKLGKNIVAVNYSGGATAAFPAQYPDWCRMIDSVGAYGILHIQATDDYQYDIDLNGDMPSLCPAEQMITVTQTDMQNNLAQTWSSKSVDMAAPWAGTYVLQTNNGYTLTSESGTSFSAPMVAGGIALIYANANTYFLDSLKSNPYKYSHKIKDIILNSVDKLTSLSGKTVSGGKLNLGKTLTNFLAYQDSLKNMQSIENLTYISPKIYAFKHRIYIQTPKSGHYTLSLTDWVGKTIFTQSFENTTSEIDVQFLPTGLYFATLNEGDQTLGIKKIAIIDDY